MTTPIQSLAACLAWGDAHENGDVRIEAGRLQRLCAWRKFTPEDLDEKPASLSFYLAEIAPRYDAKTSRLVHEIDGEFEIETYKQYQRAGRRLIDRFTGELDAAAERAARDDEWCRLNGISKSTVSKLCKDIDERVGEFLNRPLTGDWPYVWLDATYLKVRQGGRIVPVAAIIAVAANTEGRREIIGLGIGPSEAETFWTEFLRSLRARGLGGVRLVISDAHTGLKAAIARVFEATWQRCRVHWMRNALERLGEDRVDLGRRERDPLSRPRITSSSASEEATRSAAARIVASRRKCVRSERQKNDRELLAASAVPTSLRKYRVIPRRRR